MKPLRRKSKEKAEPRHQWNFIDVLLVLLLLISVVSIVMRVVSMEDRRSTANDTAVISFTSEALLPEVAKAALRESAFTFSGEKLAVSELSVTPALLTSSDENGVQYLPSTEKFCLVGKLRVTGRAAESGFFLGGKTYFVPGVTLPAVGQYTALTLTVTDIEFSSAS